MDDYKDIKELFEYVGPPIKYMSNIFGLHPNIK